MRLKPWFYQFFLGSGVWQCVQSADMERQPGELARWRLPHTQITILDGMRGTRSATNAPEQAFVGNKGEHSGMQALEGTPARWN